MQDYIVIEVQTDAQGTTSTIPLTYEDLAAAQGKYYAILAVAAVSKLPRHGAILIDLGNSGGGMRNIFCHTPAADGE